MKLSLNLPAGEHTLWSKEAAAGLVDQRFHVLAFGESYLARVTKAELYDLGMSVQITAEVETPEEEVIPEPLELALQSNPVNDVENGITYPCLPIACDAGVRHLPGCVFDVGGE